MTRLPLGLFLVWCGWAGALAGQSPDQRRTIDAFRDTLQAVIDTQALRERELLLLETSPRFRNDPLFHLRLGHLALRQGELGGPRHLDEAAAEFRWAANLAPSWPYAWLSLGYAELTLGARLSGASSAGGADRRARLAADAFSRAVQALARAVQLEPGFGSRLEGLAHRALRERSGERAGVVRDALRLARSAGPPAPRLLLALGRVERDMNDTAAAPTFAAYLASNENRSLGLVELGRTQLLQGDLSGAARYLAGAAEYDPIARAEQRADLAPVADPRELADFDARRGPAQAEFLRRFWTTRDRLELRREGERLAEHLRRLAVARREFLVVMADDTERFDDRGRIFVRHGEPDDRVSLTLPGIEPNESWRYRRGGAAGSDLLLHFVSRQAPNDYRLVESLLDVFDARATPGARTSSLSLFRSRSALAPVYRQPPALGPDRQEEVLGRERALGRRGIRVGLATDSYRIRFARDLDAWGRVLVAGGSGAQPVIQVLFAVPNDSARSAEVRVRLIALDSAGGVIASVDSLMRIESSERAPGDRSLVGRLAVPVRPGRLVTHAAIQEDLQAGTTFGIDTVLVPSPGAGQVALGDLLLGTGTAPLRVPLGDRALAGVSPRGLVRRSESLDLAAEIFGLEPGGRALVRVLIAEGESERSLDRPRLRWRNFPGSGRSTVVRASESGPIVPWRISLPLKTLAPGRWTVAVVATDRTGRTVRREAALHLVP